MIGRILLVLLGGITGLAAAEAGWLPAWDDLVRTLSFSDYNTRVVVLGVGLIGLGAGVIGAYLFLQKRALLGDALAHATLPGIGIAFLLATVVGVPGKWLPGLLLGAGAFGLVGVQLVQAITATTRLRQDAALGIVLSVFFGFGIACIGLINRLPGIEAAGLEGFIHGLPASMTADDVIVSAVVTGLVLAVVIFLHKELKLLVFDPQSAACQGWPARRLDVLLLVLVTLVVVVGLQAVGAILILAMLIIPPSAARFWTDRFGRMVVLSGSFGALSAMAGAIYSALVADLPAGGVIVLMATVVFLVSLICGRQRGLLVTWLVRQQVRRKIDRQILLRSLYERQEGAGEEACQLRDLPSVASWRAWRLRHRIGQLRKTGQLEAVSGGWRLTPGGFTHAQSVVRRYRLWQAYLLTHADTPDLIRADLPAIDAMLPVGEVDELTAFWNRERPAQPVPEAVA